MSDQKTTTQADLLLAAHAAALKARNEDHLGRNTIKFSEFQSAGFDRRDFAMFEANFDSYLMLLDALKTQDTPATAADKKAAQTA